MDHSRIFTSWIITKFLHVFHSRILTVMTIPKTYIPDHSRVFMFLTIPYFLHFLTISEHKNSGPFKNFTFFTIQELLHSWPFENFSILENCRTFTFWTIKQFYILDHSRMSTLSTIQEISHSVQLHNFQIPDYSRIFTCPMPLQEEKTAELWIFAEGGGRNFLRNLFTDTAKDAGHLRIAGCIQRPKVSGHPSHNCKWPHFRFFPHVLIDTFKKGHYKLLLRGHSQDILMSFWGISQDFLRTFWGLFDDFLRTFWLLS